MVTLMIKRNKTAYTLIEVMIVVVLLGLLAAFAIPNFQGSIRKAHERDAVMQLTLINGAQKIYFAQNGFYSPTGAGTYTQLNTDLGLNIIPNGMTYTYNRSAPATYRTTAAWTGGGGNFTVRVTQAAVSQSAPLNPCCTVAGACPTLGTGC